MALIVVICEQKKAEPCLWMINLKKQKCPQKRAFLRKAIITSNLKLNRKCSS